jgi:hypothetical protein
VTNRTRIVLDPDGYQRTVDEGAAWFKDARQIFDLYGKGPFVPEGARLWQPGGSNYLLPEPRQFDPRWYADDRLGEHVLRKALWTFAAGLTVAEWQPTHRGGWGGLFPIDYPHDQWLSFFVEAGTPTLFLADFVGLGLTVGTALPLMPVVGICNSAPVGVPLGDTGHTHYTPFIQLVAYPPPQDVFVLGWSNLALLFAGSKVFLVRTPTNDWLTWELLETLDRTNYLSGIEEQRIVDWQEQTVRAEVTAVLIAEVGDSQLYLMLSNGKGKLVRLRETPAAGEVGGAYLPAGAWWIAAPEGSKCQLQAQICGYEAVNTAGNRPVFFDYGIGQGPTQEPTLSGPVTVLHVTDPAHTTDTFDGASGETTRTSTDTDEKITWGLKDLDTGAAWDSQPDRSAYRGYFFLAFVPSTAVGVPAGGYLAPQIRDLQVLFPQLLDPRVHSELILGDTQYDRWEAESSYYQSESAKFTVDLRSEGVAAIVTSGHADRFGFPIHLEQNEGTLALPDWKLKLAFWVDVIDLKEIKLQAGSDPAAAAWKLKADCLLVRGMTQWIGPARIVDPDKGGGEVHWQFALKTALRQGNFDTEDPAAVEIVPDTSGGDFQYLPGTPDTPEGATPEGKVRQAWCAGLTERKVAYAKRIAVEWGGAVLYAFLNGKVESHPDLPVAAAAGEQAYWPRATLYKNHQSAVAAGRPKDQVYVETERLIIRPRANVVVIQGKEVSSAHPDQLTVSQPWTERDARAISDIDYENFAGEEIVERTLSRMALGLNSLKHLAQRKLRRVQRKKEIRKFVVTALWPWEIVGDNEADLGLDVGDVLTAQDLGDFVIVHALAREEPGQYKKSIFTCEKLASTAELGTDPGTWPGQGISAEP